MARDCEELGAGRRVPDLRVLVAVARCHHLGPVGAEGDPPDPRTSRELNSFFFEMRIRAIPEKSMKFSRDMAGMLDRYRFACPFPTSSPSVVVVVTQTAL